MYIARALTHSLIFNICSVSSCLIKKQVEIQPQKAVLELNEDRRLLLHHLTPKEGRAAIIRSAVVNCDTEKYVDGLNSRKRHANGVRLLLKP